MDKNWAFISGFLLEYRANVSISSRALFLCSCSLCPILVLFAKPIVQSIPPIPVTPTLHTGSVSCNIQFLYSTHVIERSATFSTDQICSVFPRTRASFCIHYSNLVSQVYKLSSGSHLPIKRLPKQGRKQPFAKSLTAMHPQGNK